MKTVLIGFGSVGQELARILTAQTGSYPGTRGVDVTVVGIVTRSHGALVNSEGLDLRSALDAGESGGFSRKLSDFSKIDGLQAAMQLDYDVLVELSSLEIKRRGEPALSHIKAAIQRGKHCVTANKGPIAFAFRELSLAAIESGSRFLFESTVLDGTPLFALARCGLRACRVVEVDGIVNSTTNFVVDQVERGISVEQAIEIARARGFTETDPSLDLNGWDAAAKVCVLANVLMGADVNPDLVERSEWPASLVSEARQLRKQGLHMKQVIRAWRESEAIRVRVRWEKIPSGHPFASVKASGSVLRVHTDLMAPFLIQQQNPGVMDTACGVINDLLEIQLTSS